MRDDTRNTRRLRAALATLLLALLAMRVISQATPAFPDDAYITMHSARVLLEGQDRAFPGVPALVGATSPFHVALISMLGSVFPLPVADEITLWLGGALFGLGLIELTANRRLSGISRAGLLAAGLTTGTTLQQLSNGQETGLAMAGVCWAIVLSERRGFRREVALPLLAGTLPFVRPELMLVPILVVLVSLRVGRPGRTIGLVLAGGLPWFAWYLLATGLEQPSTVLAKRAFFAEAGWPVAGKVNTAARGLARFGGSIGALGVGLLGLARSRVGRLALLGMSIFATAYAWQFPSALNQYDGRYLHPLVPALCWGAVLVAERRPRFGFVVLAVALSQNLYRLPASLERRQAWVSVTDDELKPISTWLRSNVDPREPVLVHDAGYLSEATPFRLVDLVGLKTPASVAVHRQLTEPSLGGRRAEAIAVIALTANTRHFVLTERFIPGLVEDLRRLGWTLTPAYSPARSPAVSYTVYRMVPPGLPAAP